MPVMAIAIAFPIAEPQRALLRRIVAEKLPSLYREGAEERPCISCGMRLNVGPRLLAFQHAQPELAIYCPICGRAAMLQENPEVIHLGNPESGWEP